MPVNRSLWQRQIAAEKVQTFPKYPCPRCAGGRLALQTGGFRLIETKASLLARNQNPDEWDPEWIEQRFTAFLECDEATCGELVVMSGESEMMPIMEEHEEYGPSWELTSMLRPRSMVPPAHPFPLSTRLPPSVKSELELAFELYWADTGACIARLRTSLENLLDDKQIAREGTNGAGNTYRLNLHQRIGLYEQQYTDSSSAESMQALRVVGNLGTHGDHVSLEHLFDALDVYEDALLDIYDQKSANLAAKKLALRSLS